MIDRNARRRLAEGIRRLGWGRITNDDFEIRCKPLIESADSAIRAFFFVAWGFYSDLEPYKLRGRHALNRRQKKLFARMILFLHSNHEYVGPSFAMSKRWAIFWLAAAGLCVTLFYYSLLFAVISLSVLILINIAKAISIIFFAGVEITGRPRQQFRWLGLNREFFLLNPTWPFAAFRDYREALRRPLYLSGHT